jgi:hypothetical protein
MGGIRPERRRRGPPPTYRGKRRRRVSPEAEEEAIKTADYFLGPFIGDVTSWNEYGSDAGNPRRELQHAIALVECALSDKSAADIFQFCYLGPSPFIELARKAAIPILKRARPAAGRNSLSWRDQLIAKIIEAVCSRHNLKPTRNAGSRDTEHDPSGCSVVAEALRRRGIKLGEKRITNEIWLKRTSH